MDYFITILKNGYLASKHNGTGQKINTIVREGTESKNSDISVTNILKEIQYHSSRIDDLTQQLNSILS